MICLTASSCKTLEEKLHPIDLCVFKKGVSLKGICYKYKYWKYKGETVGESYEVDLPEVFYFVNSNDLSNLFEDRDRGARYRKTHTCRIKKRR